MADEVEVLTCGLSAGGWPALAGALDRLRALVPEPVAPLVSVPPAPLLAALRDTAQCPDVLMVGRAFSGAVERELGWCMPEELFAREHAAAQLATALDALALPPAEWAVFRAVAWRTAQEHARIERPPVRWLLSNAAARERSTTWYRDVAGAYTVGRRRLTPAGRSAFREYGELARALAVGGAVDVEARAAHVCALLALAHVEVAQEQAELVQRVARGEFVW